MSKFPRVGKAACGNQFEAAQVRQGVPKTAFSGKVVMDKAEQIRRIARQGAFLPVTNDSVARS